MCLAVKGLWLKPSWEVWMQKPVEFSHPNFIVRSPEEGLVVLGGLIHSAESCTDVEALIGTETFLRKHVESLTSKIEAVANQFENVISLAAKALHAERISLKVFQSTMKERVTYFLRVFPPTVSRKVAERLDSIFKKTTAKILGWSEQEAAEAQLQAELHPEDGGTELAQRPSSPRCSISLRGCRARMSTRQTQQSRLRSYQLLVSLQAAMISLRKWKVYILKFDR